MSRREFLGDWATPKGFRRDFLATAALNFSSLSGADKAEAPP